MYLLGDNKMADNIKRKERVEIIIGKESVKQTVSRQIFFSFKNIFMMM